MTLAEKLTEHYRRHRQRLIKLDKIRIEMPTSQNEIAFREACGFVLGLEYAITIARESQQESLGLERAQ